MTRIAPRLRDRLCVAGFLGLWLVPVVWHGVVSPARIPGEPANFHRCHDISCLFIERPESRNAYYVEVRYLGQPAWETLDLAGYFDMEPFGYRTRMHRLLARWNGKKSRGRDELAAWLYRRHAELHPERKQPIDLRFVWAWTVPSVDEPPQRNARPGPLSEFPPERTRIMSRHAPPKEAASAPR
jgi:hypothetical protein